MTKNDPVSRVIDLLNTAPDTDKAILANNDKGISLTQFVNNYALGVDARTAEHKDINIDTFNALYCVYSEHRHQYPAVDAALKMCGITPNNLSHDTREVLNDAGQEQARMGGLTKLRYDR